MINISGSNVFGHLKYESGVHRAQRVPTTEAGRLHISTVTVALMPQPTDAQVHINESDVCVDVFRASRSDSAIHPVDPLTYGDHHRCSERTNCSKEQGKGVQNLEG
jgi:peptide chain release factor 1